MKYFRGVILLLAAGFLFSCDAPKLNPLDPLSPGYNIGQIEGYIYSYPQDPLQNVRVAFPQQNISVLSDAQGYYKIEDVEIANGYVYFEKTGFKKDSALVSWNNQKTVTLGARVLNYVSGGITGTVKSSAPSLQALSGVKVSWKNQGLVVNTDAQGDFGFNDISFNSGWIFFEVDGYSKDSLYVDLAGFLGKVKNLNTITLNSKPKLNDLNIFTSVLNRYPDSQSDSLFVKANISDAENDVDSVFVICADLNINKKLVLNPNSGYYENSFSPGDLNLTYLDEGTGKNFKIIVKDRLHNIFDIGFSTIKRVIRKDVVFRSPANLEIVKKPTTFTWERYLPGFNFRYMFEIYTNTLPAVLVKRWTDIPKDAINFTPAVDLAPGEYIWVIWAVDDFNDRIRSFPASFVVQ